MKRIGAIVTLFFIAKSLSAQADRWQQRIKYDIDVKMNVNTNRFIGTEKIEYTNNSPDTLDRVFFHAYWNAFQPNSSMDVRSRELGEILIGKDVHGKDVYDRHKNVYNRISTLSESEIGFQRILSAKVNGAEQKLKEHETIIEVILDRPLLPKTTTTFSVAFEAQAPVMIRRSGRNSVEGIKYSMAQWYPKMVEYDHEGWHANQYVGFEFYGVWGDYDVSIEIDKSYMLGASGTLQNPDETGFGYQPQGVKVSAAKGNTITWHFVANNVHDFVWAADPTYKKITRNIAGGPTVHIIYKGADSVEQKWQKLADTVVMAYPQMAKIFGPYPYKNYSFIQGGDGGMEYPMATLMRNASVGTAIHEWMHSWFQGMLATNEQLNPWMDEGFTNYADSRIINILRRETAFPYSTNYRGYFNLAKSGWEEPMSTPADHFNTNYSSAAAAYSKGAVFMVQLGYIVGDPVLDKILMDYYKKWRFKHPGPNDFIRVAEKTSGLQLQWYKNYWINTTKTIDYAIDSLWDENGKTKIRVRRVGEVPMPIDLQLTFKDSSRENHYVPVNLMYGEKPVENSITRKVYPEWKWTHRTYILETDRRITELTEVEIDPSQRLADIDRRNNLLKIKW